MHKFCLLSETLKGRFRIYCRAKPVLS